MRPETLSIIIPQYRTEWFIRLCLRSLRKYSRGPVQVIVVDNNSADGSTEYLKKVPWIELIENKSGSVGAQAHREALDLGVERAKGEWVCLFHSDTIVLKPGWDMTLLDMLKQSGAAGLSTFDRDVNRFEPAVLRWARRLREFRTDIKDRLRGNTGHDKIMSFCFIVQRRIIAGAGFRFSDERKDVADDLYHSRIKGRHPFLILSRNQLEPILWHTSNVTSIITGQITDSKLVDKFNSKHRMLTGSKEVQDILDDETLDT